MPLAVTKRARRQLGILLDHTDHKPGQLLRLAPGRGRLLGLALGVATDDDVVVKHEGKEVLAVPRGVSHALSNATLDYDERQAETRFRIV